MQLFRRLPFWSGKLKHPFQCPSGTLANILIYYFPGEFQGVTNEVGYILNLAQLVVMGEDNGIYPFSASKSFPLKINLYWFST